MNSKIEYQINSKRSTSVAGFVFLFAFLFLLVEKELHAIEHMYEIHASFDGNQPSIEEVHDCAICHFSIDNLNSDEVETLEFSIFINDLDFPVYFDCQILPSPFTDILGRAPPVKL